MILYLPAKVEPVVNSSLGVSRVSVTGISFKDGRGVAQLLQKRAVSVLSEWHLGHFIPIVTSFYLAKE